MTTLKETGYQQNSSLIPTQVTSKRKRAGFWSRYRRNRAATVALGVLCVLVILASTKSIISPYDSHALGVGGIFEAPSWRHIMGTDDLGRDIFSGILDGISTSLLIGLGAAATATIIGALVGSISGYSGGFIDEILMRITELFMLIPRLVLALVIVALFGPSLFLIIFAIAISSWPVIARVVRAEFLTLKEWQFVDAARVVGRGKFSILFDEIFPNATSSLMVNGTLQVARAILLEAGLSYLGLGDPLRFSLGSMLYNAQRVASAVGFGWWLVVFPGLFISLITLSANLVGDGLNDAMNPRLREI